MRAPGLRLRLTFWFAGAVAIALLAFSGAVLGVLLRDAEQEAAELSAQNLDFEDPYELVFRVAGAMALAVPLGAAAAGALGYVVAGRALRPLLEASNRARAARASELNLVLPTFGRGDEWDALADTLNGLLADARASLERTRRFTADAAHELRTPLTAIIGEAEVALRRERTGEELRHSLGEVHSEGLRLSRLVEALLLLSRADAGVLVQRGEELGVLPLVEEAVRRARASASRGLAELRIEIKAEGKPVTVIADRGLLSRAIGNVIENGLRFARTRVEVELHRVDDTVRIRISDDGPGVPSGLRPRLFERFARGDPARSGEGTGLGLALSRAIVRAHGGDLDLEDSAFVFRIPAR